MSAKRINKTTNQHIQMVALSDMEPESGYQRPTNSAQVESIVRKFDEMELGTLIVSERGGKYHIIDGAHRSKALRKLGYTHALCVVFTGLTFKQEADFFRRYNKNRRPIKPMDFFKAGLAAGDEQCVKINRIVMSNGFHIGMGSNRNFFRITAVKALFTITDEYSYEALDDTLCLLAGTWSGIPRASQSECLLGVAEFVSRYGMTDFAERMKDKFPIVFYDYTESVRVRVAASSVVSRKKFCRVLVKHYNKGLANNSRKRLKWED